MPDRVGQQLGNYRLLRLLGRGGFAEVYLGEHRYLKRRAALKILHTSLEDEEVDQFLAEAQTLARLEHPQIVRVLDFAVEQDGTPFLVMDYAPRGTLLQRHPRGSYLSLETTVAYVKQVAAALQYAHNHHVIHRDVKPGNILLGANQQVMLSDFGLALFTPSPEQLSTQAMSGTIPYMAPEQIRGRPGFTSDQYALGIVAYEWLCGVRPFEGAPWQIAYQHTSVPPPRLREHDPSLPEAVEAVVLKALSKDPRERYVSVQQFAQALEKASAVHPRDLSPDSEVTAPLGPISPAPPASPTVLPRRLFVSASRADDAFVARFTADLQQRGITVWCEDPSSTQHLLDQEDAVRQAIRAVEVVVVVLSPNARSSRTIKEHLRIASLYQRRLVFVWAAGEEIAGVLPEAWGKAAQIDLIDARAGRYESALDEVMTSLAEDETPQAASTLLEPAFAPRNPYKGLRAFTSDDAADFFGRDSLTQELVDRVKGLLTPGQPGTPTARLLAVLGASGSGKSSVVLAGLLPRLEGGAVPGSQEWVFLSPMVPGTHPLEALALTLAPRLPDRSVKHLREDLEDESARGLHRLSAQLVNGPGQQVVLFIDQFEEVFTQTASEEEREHFIDLLVTATTEPHGPVIVLLTLRADFYDRPLSYPALYHLIETHQKAVLPMTVADLRAVIKGPAALPDVQLSFEGNLVGDLLFEVQGQVGALPLLQFTLDQLFQRRSGRQLTLSAYRELGGVKGALTRQAEETYAALPSEEHRKLARALFVRLIDPGASEQDTTRRRAALSEFSLPEVSQTRLLQEVADAFIAARLLTTNEIAGTTTIEVSHEALIREWPRLAGWLREAREDIHLQQAISKDATEWEQRNKPGDRLYRGSQLKEARAWARRNMPSGDEVAFLRAGAASRVRSLVRAIAVLLLLVSAMSIADWFFLTRPPDIRRVTNLNDNGPGSLRQAIVQAPSKSTIMFDTSLRGTILLSSGDLNIAKDLTIRGPGAGKLSISSGKSGYIVHVISGTTVTISGLTFKDSKISNIFIGSISSNVFIHNEGTLTLSNSTVSDNTSTDHGGGSIDNFGTLTLTNSTVSDNAATGIDNFGTLTLTNSTVSGNTDGGIVNNTVSGNTATGGNGGIVNSGSGTLILTNSTVSGNTSTNGGGIFNFNGTVTLSNSTVSGNTATGGGGIYNGGTVKHGNITVSGNTVTSTGNGGGGGTLTLSNSTVSGNTSTDGGGIYNQYGTVTLSNSTVSGNTVTSGNGGGIFNGDTLTLTNSTISDNKASSDGGGIFIQSDVDANGAHIAHVDLTFSTIYNNTAHGGGDIAIEDIANSSNGNSKAIKQVSQVKVRNSIVAGDPTHPGPDIVGMLTSYGYNLFQGNSGATFDPSTSTQHSTDKTLSVNDLTKLFANPVVLQVNSGPTKTYALAPGTSNPAINKVPLDTCHITVPIRDVQGTPIAQYTITTDQRGMKRPDGNENACDIGAYELNEAA